MTPDDIQPGDDASPGELLGDGAVTRTRPTRSSTAWDDDCVDLVDDARALGRQRARPRPRWRGRASPMGSAEDDLAARLLAGSFTSADGTTGRRRPSRTSSPSSTSCGDGEANPIVAAIAESLAADGSLTEEQAAVPRQGVIDEIGADRMGELFATGGFDDLGAEAQDEVTGALLQAAGGLRRAAERVRLSDRSRPAPGGSAAIRSAAADGAHRGGRGGRGLLVALLVVRPWSDDEPDAASTPRPPPPRPRRPPRAAVDGEPGAAGVGDPYYPGLGNGGFDVEHYTLDLTWLADQGALEGVATIEATATQDLSRFDLDLAGLEVRSVTVDGEAAEVSPRRIASSSSTRPRTSPRAPTSRRSSPTAGKPDADPRGHRHLRSRLADRRTGGLRGVGAVGRADVLPGERPPDRQGHLHDPRHRAGGPDGGRQRAARRRERHRARHPLLDLRGHRPDGQLPRADRHRRLRAGRRREGGRRHDPPRLPPVAGSTTPPRPPRARRT